MSSLESLPDYYVPEWEDYECHATGQCCHGWVVTVDREHREQIEAALRETPHPKWGSTMPLDEEGDTDTLTVEEGRCPYLTGDGLCWLHKQFGKETKPETCQTYPRETITTPMGVFHNLQISCVTSARMLATNGYELPVVDSTVHDEEPDPFQFNAGADISSTTYQRLEETVLELLSNEEYPVHQRLAATGSYLHSVGRRLDRAPDGDGFQRLNERWLKQPTIPDGDRAGHATIVSSILEHREQFLGRVRQLGTHHEVEQMIGTLRDIFGFNEAPPSTIVDRLDRIYEQRWKPSADINGPILERYLRRKIWSKTLTYRFSLVEGMNILANLFAIIRLVTMAAAEINNTSVKQWHLLNSIVKVERCFTQSRDNQYLWSEILNQSVHQNRWLIANLSLL